MDWVEAEGEDVGWFFRRGGVTKKRNGFVDISFPSAHLDNEHSFLNDRWL